MTGSAESSSILQYLVDTSPPAVQSLEGKEQQKKNAKSLPNLIPISQSPILKAKTVDGVLKLPISPLPENRKPEKKVPTKGKNYLLHLVILYTLSTVYT